MEQYLRRTPLSAFMDRIGLKISVVLGCLLFFILLWGARPSAFLAGAALGLLSLLLLKKGEKRRFQHREKRLRAAIGGELALERLLLAPAARAHFEIVMLLSGQYEMTLLKTLEAGVLCQVRGETVLISFLQKHTACRCDAQDILRFQRIVKQEKAIRGVLCLPCEIDENARAQAQRQPRITIFSRRTLIRLLGGANPATDEQLVALGKRRRERTPKYQWMRRILSPQRAPRYALYGSLLLLLFVLTGLPYYPVPGIILVLLAAFSRCVPSQREEL